MTGFYRGTMIAVADAERLARANVSGPTLATQHSQTLYVPSKPPGPAPPRPRLEHIIRDALADRATIDDTVTAWVRRHTAIPSNERAALRRASPRGYRGPRREYQLD